MKGSPAKRAKISWGEKEEAAFKAIKEALTTENLLRHPQISKSFIIDPDSSQ
jgi:hypothetical protein